MTNLTVLDTSKKPKQPKSQVSRFSVYFRTPTAPAVVVTAVCHQEINGSIYFFAEDAKTIGKFLAAHVCIPESVACFRKTDISHIIKDSEVVGAVPVADLINLDYATLQLSQGSDIIMEEI